MAADGAGAGGGAAAGRWNDLSTRILSAAVMVVVGAGEIALGGVWFQVLVVFVVSMIIWEVARIVRPVSDASAAGMAALGASVLSGVLAGFGPWWDLALIALVPVLGLWLFRPHGVLFAMVTLYVQAGGWALVQFRLHEGLAFVLWLLAVVIATDILGYFAGRLIGGPKFWPRVSPKKTWSGTVAGWIGAAGCGLAFMGPLGAGPWLIPVSVALSMASQAGDIGESALKRRFAVKDSSALIPGHGGVFDRFDALMGACVFLLALGMVAGWPR